VAWGQVVDVSQGYELVDRQFVLFAFQAIEPTGRNLVGLIAAFLSKAMTAFLDLPQRELPLPAYHTEP
jgi:hypothetical protein